MKGLQKEIQQQFISGCSFSCDFRQVTYSLNIKFIRKIGVNTICPSMGSNKGGDVCEHALKSVKWHTQGVVTMTCTFLYMLKATFLLLTRPREHESTRKQKGFMLPKGREVAQGGT
jgi:hypothetical protein